MYYKNKSKQPSQVKIISADWRSIPWETANTLYTEAADLAEETAFAAYQQQVLEKYPDSDTSKLVLPNRAKIRRRAGNRALTEVFIPRYKLDAFGVHVIAQIVAHLGTLSLQNAHGENILADPDLLASVKTLGDGIVNHSDFEFQTNVAISGLEFVKAHFNTPQMMGVYRFLMLDSRSSYLTKQYTGDAKSYCSLVPLVLSAFKRNYDIPYQAWKRDELQLVVNADLHSAMMYEYNNSISRERLLELRDMGLVWQSGANAGKSRNPLYTHTLYGLKDTEFDNVPDLAQVMLTQIWCAHPENRTRYMVLDPVNWDKIPSALINPTVFIPPSYVSQQSDLPWLN